MTIPTIPSRVTRHSSRVTGAGTYDAENRLTKVEEFTFGNPTPVATSTYRYDGLGRRIEKVGNGQTRRYVYDGEDILLEYDGANVLQARYTHGPGIDEPIAVTKAGSTFFYHQDGLGTVTELTDSTGSTAKAYAYDAYGNQLETTGTVDQPYTYTGREFDAEIGFYYYRARHYDPATGRFLQKDPIGTQGHGANLYSYANENPVNLVDPLGLFPNCGSGRQALIIPDFNLSPACMDHDKCYDRCGANKGSCDRKFLDDMILICRRLGFPGGGTCFSTAFVYYGAVISPAGDAAFRAAQSKCKGC